MQKLLAGAARSWAHHWQVQLPWWEPLLTLAALPGNNGSRYRPRWAGAVLHPAPIQAPPWLPAPWHTATSLRECPTAGLVSWTSLEGWTFRLQKECPTASLDLILLTFSVEGSQSEFLSDLGKLRNSGRAFHPLDVVCRTDYGGPDLVYAAAVEAQAVGYAIAEGHPLRDSGQQ